MNINDALIFFAAKYEGDFHRIYHALNTHEKVDVDQYLQLKKNIHHKSITLIDKNYPDFFKEINCPPIVLFYTGNKGLYDEFNPIKEIVLDDGTRAYCTIDIAEQNNKLVFDYAIACENHDQVDKLMEHIKHKGIPLKDYSINKNKNEQVH